MNSALKWKLIAGFVLVFLAGGATGVFVSATTAHYFFGAHRHGFAAQAMKSRLQWHLRLTDEQMTKISPIIEKTGTKLEEIRGDTGRRVRETIAEAHREIAPSRTPAHSWWCRNRLMFHREAANVYARSTIPGTRRFS